MSFSIIRAALVAVSVLGVTACSSSWSTTDVKRSGAAVSGPAARSPASIIISEEDILDRPYRVIGDVNVTVNKTTIFNSDPTPEAVNEKLREEAGKLGADAVILVRYGSVGMSMMSWGSLDGKGRAIAFTE